MKNYCYLYFSKTRNHTIFNEEETIATIGNKVLQGEITSQQHDVIEGCPGIRDDGWACLEITDSFICEQK